MTPPEASSEYSRGVEPPRGVFAHGAGAPAGPSGGRAGQPLTPAQRRLFAGGFGGAAVGALLLLIAEFTTLFDVHVAGIGTISSVTAGSHHSYALVPVALLAALFAWAVWRTGSRPALVGIAGLGVIALLIGVLGDLPDAQATGLAFRAGHYVPASATPSVGLYLETLGAVVLLAAGVATLMLVGPPAFSRPHDSATRRH